MANVFVDDSTLTAVADAIREKTGTTAKMRPSEMAGLIEGLEAGTASFTSGTITPSEDSDTFTLNQDLRDCNNFAVGIYTDANIDDGYVIMAWYFSAGESSAGYAISAAENAWDWADVSDLTTGAITVKDFGFEEGIKYKWFLAKY